MSDEFGRTVKEHGSAMYRIAWRILGHAQDVEDVLQDVFLEAYDFSQREPVSSWVALLKRLTVCRSLDRLRARRPTRVNVDQVELASVGDSPVDSAMLRELRARLRCELSKLSPRQGEVFCLRYFDDLSNSQIADALEISPASVATALHKSRLKLSECLVDILSPGACDET